MGDDTLEKTGTGMETPNNPNPDPAQELERIKAENEALRKQNSDKDKQISDISSERSTLEARLRDKTPQEAKQLDTDLQKEAARILETAQVDPAKAGEDLAVLISGVTNKAQQAILGNLQPIIEQNAYVAKIKQENADLIDLGLEQGISFRASQLMQSGKSFKEAVDSAVKESRDKVKKLTSNSQPTPPPTPPPSSIGEIGSNRQPPKVEPRPEPTEQDEINAERERRRKSGL